MFELIEKLEERIAKLETLLESVSGGIQINAINRERLANQLGVSQRWLMDDPEFKSIAVKKGGRVFYPINKVKIILNTREKSYDN